MIMLPRVGAILWTIPVGEYDRNTAGKRPEKFPFAWKRFFRAFAAWMKLCSSFRHLLRTCFGSVGGWMIVVWSYDVRRMSGVRIATVGRLCARASNY